MPVGTAPARSLAENLRAPTGTPILGTIVRQLFRRKSMRCRTIKTTLSARNGRRGLLLGQHTDAPHQPAPRFETVFFRSRRIVSRLICLIPGCARAARSKSSSVQRLAPVGRAEHASAVICASTSVRYLRGLPGRCTSATAWSRPPSRYAARVSPRSFVGPSSFRPSRTGWSTLALKAFENLLAEIKQGRSDRRSSPWSRPLRSPSRTSVARRRSHRLRQGRSAQSSNRR